MEISVSFVDKYAVNFSISCCAERSAFGRRANIVMPNGKGEASGLITQLKTSVLVVNFCWNDLFWIVRFTVFTDRKIKYRTL